MAMTFRGKQLGEVAADIRQYAKNVKDVSDAWDEVGDYLSKVVRQQFASQGTRLGKRWAPLKPDYRLWKIREGYSRKILHQTGELEDSFTRRPMSVERHGKQEATFGSDNPKAIWHQKGTRRNGKRVNPPRPMLLLTPEVRKQISSIVKKEILRRR